MTPQDLLTVSAANSPTTAPQESASAALDAMLHQVAMLKSEMLVHQQESDVLGQHTEQNLVKIRALMGKI